MVSQLAPEHPPLPLPSVKPLAFGFWLRAVVLLVRSSFRKPKGLSIPQVPQVIEAYCFQMRH